MMEQYTMGVEIISDTYEKLIFAFIGRKWRKTMVLRSVVIFLLIIVFYLKHEKSILFINIYFFFHKNNILGKILRPPFAAITASRSQGYGSLSKLSRFDVRPE